MRYSSLNNYELITTYKNLINGMNTFTDKSKIKYKEAWERRIKDKFDLELVLEDRCIDLEFILNNDLSEDDCDGVAALGKVVFNYKKILWISSL